MAIAGKIWPPVPPPLMMILKPFPIVFILFLLILYAYIDAAPGSCLSEGTDVFFSFRCKSNQNFAPYPPFSKKLSKVFVYKLCFISLPFLRFLSLPLSSLLLTPDES